MAMPAKDKTWQHTVGSAYGGSGTLLTDHQKLLRAIKNAMIGFALGAWSVSGSSDAATAGMDTTDRWTADNKLIWEAEGNAHSWMVLRQTGIKANFEILLDCVEDTSGCHLLVMASASAGFSGGSTTARPTATDEYPLLGVPAGTGLSWVGTSSGSSSFSAVLQAMGSTDGACTRILAHVNGALCLCWIFDKLKSPVAGWSDPSASLVAEVKSQASSIDTYSKLWVNVSVNASEGRIWTGSTSGACFFGGEGHGGKCSCERFTLVSDWDGNWPLLNVYAISDVPGGQGAPIGTFYDLWWGSPGLAEGTTFPAAATKLYAQFATLIYPWDASTPVLS